MATNFDIDLDNNQDNFDIDLNDQVESFVVDFGEITWVTNDDFNKLKNRPSYNSQVMTGDTNIPLVPTATSQLTNDANFQNTNDLSTAISNHNQSSSAHQDIRQAITDEATARFNADNGLQGQIDAITSASDVVDIVGTYAELQAYDTQHLKDNDVIKVLQDETHNDAMTYWRWSTHTDTWTYIGAEGPYYTKSETNTLLDEKLDADEVPDGFFDGPATVSPAEGTSVEIEGGLKLKSVNLKGDTTQQTYSGKNLFNKNGALSNGWLRNDGNLTSADDWKITDYIQIKPNTAYTTSGFENGSGVNPSRCYYDNTQTFISGVVHNANNPFSNTSPANAYYMRESCKLVDLDTIQIEEGSTPTSYEPYVGGTASPNPGYPQNVNVVTGTQTVTLSDGTNSEDYTVKLSGDNLFDRTNASPNALLTWATGAEAPHTGSITSDYVIASEGVTFIANYIVIPFLFDKSKNYIGVLKTNGNVTKTSDYAYHTGSFTIPSGYNVGYIRFSFRSSQGDNPPDLTDKNIMVNYGSTLLPYVPFYSYELAKIGTYQDYIYKSGDDWYVHKEIGKVLLDGSETWTAQSTYAYYHAQSDAAIQTPNTSPGAIRSNYYTAVALSQMAAKTVDYGIGLPPSDHRIFIRNKDCADSTALKTWLTTHNTTVYYVLATPTDTKITNSVLIGQLDAVLDAVLYSPTTYLVNSGNLPAILKLEAFTGNLNSLLEIASGPDNKVFVGTDGNVAGKSGLVPAPKATDDDKFLKSDGTWATVSGGSSVNVVQTVGNSQTDVMSQRAVTSMVFKDPATRYQTLISGGSSDTSGVGSVALGYGAQAYGQQAIAIASGIADASRAISIGGHANNSQGAKAQGSIALGYGATTTQVGEMNIGSSDTSYGYATSNYRLISGVYDGQNAHDAVTVGQINDTIDAINTALSTNIPHIGAST